MNPRGYLGSSLPPFAPATLVFCEGSISQSVAFEPRAPQVQQGATVTSPCFMLPSGCTLFLDLSLVYFLLLLFTWLHAVPLPWQPVHRMREGASSMLMPKFSSLE